MYSSEPPIAVEVFAGIGGFSLGIERAGFDLVAAVELDPNHAAVHSFNFPRTAIVRSDAKFVSASEIRDAVQVGLAAHGRCESQKQIDLLAGGPPCQGFSVGGTQDPTDDRNELVFAFARIVRDLQPRYFVMENVPGLLRPKHRETWNRLVNSLKDAGYDLAEPSVLNAAEFGVPQIRQRLFLYGWCKGEDPVAAPAGRTTVKVTVRDALQGLPEASSYPQLYEKDVLLLDNLSRRIREDVDKPQGAYAKLMRSETALRGFRRPWSKSAISGMALTLHKKKVIKRFEKTSPGDREPISRYARLDLSGLSPTIRSGTGPDHGSHTPPRPIHPLGTRVITVREAARLQSFPDWFCFHATKWHAWRGIGNAVPPQLAHAVAEIVAEKTGAMDSLRGTLERNDPKTIGYEQSW